MLDESPRLGQPIPCIVTTSMMKKWWVLFWSVSLLGGTEGLICQPELRFRQICCLPGTRVKYVTRKFPSLVWSTDYYLLLLCHVGTNKVIAKSPMAIKKDFRALVALLKRSGVHVVLSSVLPVVGNGIKRNRQTHLINTWLWVGFFDHGIICATPGLLEPTGFTFLSRGKILLLTS